MAELPDWEQLREAGEAIKADTMASLERIWSNSKAGHRPRRGGALGPRRHRSQSHRRRPGARDGATEAVKVKSIVTDEIGLNDALAAAASPPTRPTWPS